MRDLAVKYAILAYQHGDKTPFKTLVHTFLNLAPERFYPHLKTRLPASVVGVVGFAFSDQAVADIIAHEFDIDLKAEQPGLIFKKPYLDGESIRMAGAVTRAFSVREQEIIDNRAAWLLDATRSLYREALNPSRMADIRKEYQEMLRLYAQKYTLTRPDVLQRLASLSAMSAFTHAMTVDALYKGDAAKALFGEHAPYAQAWFRKQVFRNLIAKACRDYILSFAA